MTRLLLTLIALLVATATAQAQATIQPNRLTLWVIPEIGDAATVGAIAATTVLMNAAGASWCNLAVTQNIPPPYINPKLARVPDPFVSGSECEIAVPTQLLGGGAIPNGNFRLVSTFGSDTCIIPPSSAPQPCESPRADTVIPFQRALSAKPAAPTALRISQSGQ